MLDRALTATFRNLSTLILLGAVVFVPLHLAHAFVFRNVHTVADLAGDIAEFPGNKKVRNVGPAELDDERRTSLVLVIAELGLSIVLLGAAKRTIETDDAGRIPTIAEGFEHAIAGLKRVRIAAPSVPPLLACGAIGALAGWLSWQIVSLAGEVLGNDTAFVAVGLARGSALAVFVAFVAGPIAALSGAPVPREPESLDLY